jgi:4-hydroxybenzoate polyprenyltransferase
MSLWGCITPASKRYQQRSIITMSVYVLMVFSSAWIVKHHNPHGWLLYLLAVLPALPVILTVGLMGRYLQEETDEYQRLQTTHSILMGTAALLATVVVNDFIRSYTSSQGVPPFAGFIIFCAAFALTQLVQRLRDRRSDEEPSA